MEIREKKRKCGERTKIERKICPFIATNILKMHILSVLRKLFAAKKRSKSSLTTMDIFYFNMVLGMLLRNFSRPS